MDLLPSLFLQRVKDSAEREAFGQRSPRGWEWASWGETGERAVALAAGLLAAGFAPGTRVGLLSATRREWVESEMAVMLAGGVVVPIHPATTGPAALDVVRRAALRWAFVEEPLQAEKLLPAAGPDGPLGRIVPFDTLSRLTGADARGRLEIAVSDLPPCDAELLPFADLLEQGRHEVRRGAGVEVEARAKGLRPDDPATIVFNWSAAGRPLATVLTHDNLAFTTAAIPALLEVTAQDRSLLFLPLAHVYPRLLVWAAVQVGFGLGFAPARGEALRAAAEMKPDFLVVVPRFLERLRRGLMQELEQDPLWTRRPFEWALEVGRRFHEARSRGGAPLLLDLQHRLADRLAFRALRERFGGRLRFIVSGGAPLEPETARYFEAVGLPVLEGYGMTESTGLVSSNRPSQPRPGTVGRPVPDVDLRFGPDGEILVRGRNVMHGYLDDPGATDEVLDADRWLHSGDLGALDADGCLRITGRKKDVIVTEGGKNVSPLHLENLLREQPLLADALVVGDRRAYLVALLVLDGAELRRVASRGGILLTAPEESANHPELRARLDQTMTEVNRYLDPFLKLRAWAVVGDLDAAGKTGRARREALEERYRTTIHRLYSRP
ncbi:MAG: AMP-binding protein [Deltaproteobacteria bacterium]|nr:AMP-binding protein [Deltaproteobacteria bacterium]